MNHAPTWGVIADDYTGATDIAGMMARAGWRVVLSIGVPDEDPPADADVVVIALKSRSCPPDEAVAMSLAALDRLEAVGVRQVFFKYCSTFDSTDRGNIGPVADALADRLGAEAVVFCPSVPELGRTTYLGHLFVGDRLLSESSLRHHPINPMTDSDLRRVLGRQTARRVGLLDLATIRAGRRAIDAVRAGDDDYLIADAVDDSDLDALAAAVAVADARLVTGGSGLGAAIARAHGRAAEPGSAEPVRIPAGRAIVLAGSCSAATREQLAVHAERHPIFRLDVHALDRGDDVVADALAFIDDHSDAVPAVVAGTDPEAVARVQADLGVERSAELVEGALGRIARAAAARGVRRILVAGGETSGSVVNHLGVTAMRIGTEVAPGVPWMVAPGGQSGGTAASEPLGLVLKSGNFGGPDVFRVALEIAEAS